MGTRTGNPVMKRELADGTTLDVTQLGTQLDETTFELRPGAFVEGRDYCDPGRALWVWWIGRETATGRVLASVDPHAWEALQCFECIWLR